MTILNEPENKDYKHDILVNFSIIKSLNHFKKSLFWGPIGFLPSPAIGVWIKHPSNIPNPVTC